MTRVRFSAAAAGFLLSAAVLLSGCSGNESTSGAAAPEQDVATDGKAAPGTADKPAGPQPGQGAAQPSLARAIVKTGSLTIETTEDLGRKRQDAIAVATGLRGHVASEDTGSDSEGRITRVNLVLKVPTASYETAIQRLSELGKRTAIQQESTDVTEQVVDVESRIASQRASLQRMRALLARANTVAEIVSVETELTRREADLESLLAKQKALSGQTELATLNLVLAAPGKTPTPSDDRGFVAGLRSGWNAFTATFFALATAAGAVLPFLVTLALIAIPLWRFRHHLRRTPTVVPAPAGGDGPPRPDQS